MNEREQLLLRAVQEQLGLLGRQLIARGWKPELVAFTGDVLELPRVPGVKVALVVPLDSVPEVLPIPVPGQENT